MNDVENPPRDWYVVFNAGGRRWWWSKYLQPGFSHAFVIGEITEKLSVAIDPVLHGCNIIHWNDEAEIVARCYASYPDHTVLKVTLPGEPRKLFQLESHCVGVVKRIMGIESGLTLTPHGLYRLLCRKYAATQVNPF